MKVNKGKILITQEYLINMITSNEDFKRNFIERLPESATPLHVTRSIIGGVFYIEFIDDSFPSVDREDIPIMNKGLHLKKEYARDTEDA